jgi:hypothetical protein
VQRFVIVELGVIEDAHAYPLRRMFYPPNISRKNAIKLANSSVRSQLGA